MTKSHAYIFGSSRGFKDWGVEGKACIKREGG